MFGIIGERWKTSDYVQIIKEALGTNQVENPDLFVSEIPEALRPPNFKTLEDGCYW
jgi:hypothetical protein